MEKIFDRIIRGGECFSFKFSEDSGKGYFFINETEKINGQTVYIMCEMCLPHEMDITKFWKMSERFLKENIKNGKITTYN